jgi:hypothetical protein
MMGTPAPTPTAAAAGQRRAAGGEPQVDISPIEVFNRIMSIKDSNFRRKNTTFFKN